MDANVGGGCQPKGLKHPVANVTMRDAPASLSPQSSRFLPMTPWLRPNAAPLGAYRHDKTAARASTALRNSASSASTHQLEDAPAMLNEDRADEASRRPSWRIST
jgi:hypothetical protein